MSKGLGARTSRAPCARVMQAGCPGCILKMDSSDWEEHTCPLPRSLGSIKETQKASKRVRPLLGHILRASDSAQASVFSIPS